MSDKNETKIENKEEDLVETSEQATPVEEKTKPVKKTSSGKGKKIMIGVVAALVLAAGGSYYTAQAKVTESAEQVLQGFLDKKIIKSYDSVACSGISNPTCVIKNIVYENTDGQGNTEVMSIGALVSPSLIELARVTDENGNFKMPENKSVNLNVEFHDVKRNGKSPADLRAEMGDVGPNVEALIEEFSKEAVSVYLSIDSVPNAGTEGIVQSLAITVNTGDMVSLGIKEKTVTTASVDSLAGGAANPMEIMSKVSVKYIELDLKTQKNLFPRFLHAIYQDKILQVNEKASTEEEKLSGIKTVNNYFFDQDLDGKKLDVAEFGKFAAESAVKELKKSPKIPDDLRDQIVLKSGLFVSGADNTLLVRIDSNDQTLGDYMASYGELMTGKSPTQTTAGKKTTITIK